MMISTSKASAHTQPWRWPHFTPLELACKGSGHLMVHADLLDKLEALRTALDLPLVISSGYRSPEHNVKVSDSGIDGPHTTGRAVDIKVVDSATRYRIVKEAMALGFTGIGVAKTFVHLDIIKPGGERIARPMFWLY